MFDGFWEVTEIAHNSIYSSAYRGYTSKIYIQQTSLLVKGGGTVQVGKKMAVAGHWWNLGYVCVRRERKVGARVKRGVEKSE